MLYSRWARVYNVSMNWKKQALKDFRTLAYKGIRAGFDSSSDWCDRLKEIYRDTLTESEMQKEWDLAMVEYRAGL